MKSRAIRQPRPMIVATSGMPKTGRFQSRRKDHQVQIDPAAEQHDAGHFQHDARVSLARSWKQDEEWNHPVQHDLATTIGPHGPCVRADEIDVSSGMFEYQISMYWLNQIYIQKQLNPSSSLLRSCRCSSLNTPASGPLTQQDAGDDHRRQRRRDQSGKLVHAPHRAEPHRLQRHDPVDSGE